MSSPTSKRLRLSASRTSLSGRTSLQGGQSSLPRPTSIINTGRLTSTQPTYDFIAGGQPEESSQPLKRSTSLRRPSFVKPDSSHDESLRARISTLEYELKNVQQDRSMLALQHEKELRDLQIKSEADFKKNQAAESASRKASQKYDALSRELRDAQDQSINEKASLERRLRDLQEQYSSLKEDAEDAQAQLSDQERQYKHQLGDVEAKRAALQETVDKIKLDMDRLTQAFESSQAQLAKRDLEIESLDAQVLTLKTHTGDSETLSVVQRELSDQVEHIRRLESTNREQAAELRRLRESHKSVQVVEEQKRALEIEVRELKDVHRQLGEAQIQKEMLEDEKRTWTSLLEGEGQEVEFDSPEAVVKALVQQRIEHASVIDRLGTIEAELSEKDEMVRGLEEEKSTLQAEVAKLAATTPATTEDIANDGRAYKRLERQRQLALKEVEYLRAQVKTFDSEETMMMDNKNFDVQRSQQVQDLESLVDQYKSEIQTLHADLLKQESAATAPPQTEPRGTKRPAESQDPDTDTSSQLGPLLRKNKNLQTALQKATQQSQMLATELQAVKTQLKSLRASSKVRILELRDNPTANAEGLKMSTLATLKAENAALLQQLRGEDLTGIKVVPVSTVDHLKLDLQEMEKVVAEKEKRMRRLREIWTNKAAEFRDIIASVLGYKITFLPNGKVKLSSMYYGGRREADDNVNDDGDEVDENFIMFDGENGTMKISGGPDGAFGREIAKEVKFWVQEQKEIPCFLAALTLEFHEKWQRGQGVK